MTDSLPIYYHMRLAGVLLNMAKIVLKNYRSDNKSSQIARETRPEPAQSTAIDQRPEIDPNRSLHGHENAASYSISTHLEFLIALTSEAESFTAAITPKHQERLLSCEQHSQKAPRISLDQARVDDNWTRDTQPGHLPKS